MTQKSLMTVGEVAAMFAVSVNTVRRLAERGHLTSRRLPSGHSRFAREEVERARQAWLGEATSLLEEA